MTAPTWEKGPVKVYFGEKNGKYPDGNQVVVTGKDTRVVFDTPLASNRMTDVLEGADLLILGHAHEDHCAAMHRLSHVPVYAPEEDLYAIQSIEGMMAHYGYSEATLVGMREKITSEFFFEPRPDARPYQDNMAWELGGGVRIRAIHTPGHTRGHCVLMVEPGDIAFIGDIDLSGFGPYYGDACSDLNAFRDTLVRMEHLEASAWITFHHKGVVTGRDTYLELLGAFRDKIDRREAAIYDTLGAGGKTLEDLVAHRFMYPQGYSDVFLDDAERICTSQHLALLLAEGRIVEEGGVYRQAGAGKVRAQGS